jgi:LPPG:FO 2-phospho-L-lactate transferase
VLAGGTGGAKLARGIDALDEELVVIANTGDDIEIYDAWVSPDPDLILFGLAGRLDSRGWGLDGDTFEAMDALRAQGEDVWFNLGDEDLAIGRRRLARLREGARLTEALDELREELGVTTRVLPMCDEPAPTTVDGIPFQEWMIRHGGTPGEVQAGGGTVTPEVADAIAAADAVVIGPSNPVISIDPILKTTGVREALAGKTVVAVSPFVHGEIVKGPTAAFLPTLADVATFYGDLVDAWVADEQVSGAPTLLTGVGMPDAAGRRRLAEEVVRFALGFAP